MKISEISINKPVMSWMIVVGLILFGLVSLTSIGVSEMPDVDFPVVDVQATYRGAAPEIMETDVADVLEESVMTLEGIRSISTSCKHEEANITIEFELSRDIDQAVQDVQTKIAQAQKRLPDDMDPPIVTKTNPEDNPIMWVSLSSTKEGSLRDVMTLARNQVKDRFQTVTGVGEIILSGFINPVVRVWLIPEKLKEYELTVNDILDAIQTEHREIPAGRMETETTESEIRFYGEAVTVEDFQNIYINKRGGNTMTQPIRLGDIARVEAGLDDIRRISRTNGGIAVGLGIKKQRGFNAVAVADEIKKRMAEIQKTLPPDMLIQVNFDSTNFIRESAGEMKFELIMAALLTGIVCFVFLGSFNTTLNILIAIPTSIIGSFMFIKFFGFTFNNFTFLALTLAIGIVVDDAIMVLENIVRHQEMGKKPYPAAMEGTREIAPATLATTMAILAIFVPVIFMEGVMGKFFLQFGIVLCGCVILSLIEALTLTPSRSARLKFINHNPNRLMVFMDKTFTDLSQKYSDLLEKALNNKKKVLISATLIFIGSMALLPFIKKEFVPSQDQSMFLVIAQTPMGSSINFTSGKMAELEKIVAEQPEVLRYFVAVGGFGGGEVTRGMMFITMKSIHDRDLSQAEFMNKLREKFKAVPGLFTVMQDLSTRGLTAKRGFPIEFSVRGPNWQKLSEISKELMDAMKADPDFKDVDTDYKFGQPEIRVIPNRIEAGKRGVSMEAIGKVLEATMGSYREGKFTEGGRRNDIMTRLDTPYRQQAADIKNLFVRNNRGELVSLADVVTTEEVKTLQSITRQERERAISIYSNIGDKSSQQTAIKKVEALAKKIVPSDYRLVFSGSAQTFAESFGSLGFALILGLIVAYMVLASQYNNYVHPLTVLLALPFAFSGAFMALFIFGKSINIYSFIGLILLMGIAKKNSIMLVDFISQRRTEGLSLKDAIVKASPQRLRPILMTSITIIASAIPTALGLGPGSEVRVPLSLVIIGGMILSTGLTLFVVPCAYAVLARLERRT
ncbi:efflux RND transporter permease subunit [bacterium]|nr:efflux RND transporter permease subunit [bacterium]